MNLLAVILLGVGMLLIYSAIKNQSPKAVVLRALRKEGD